MQASENTTITKQLEYNLLHSFKFLCFLLKSRFCTRLEYHKKRSWILSNFFFYIKPISIYTLFIRYHLLQSQLQTITGTSGKSTGILVVFVM